MNVRVLAVVGVFVASRAIGGELQPVPAWLFPSNLTAPATPRAATFDAGKSLHIPTSDLSFNEAELTDLFAAPDWHPQSHTPMPAVVSHGNAPQVYACGFCHMPGGQGRPENAALAGLPAVYIVKQVADFKSGARRSAWQGDYLPTSFMIHLAAAATPEEVAAAADYFSTQPMTRRYEVVERARVPQFEVRGWVYVAKPGAGSEPIGQRLLEFTPDFTRHEIRDDDLRYVAFVPPGSVGRGRVLANAGAGGAAAASAACAACHGSDLRGVGLVPPLAGRSPTYLLRQLLAFKTGARSGANGLPMRAVLQSLKLGGMIDVAAYAASLPP